jgi:uncharacterized repeat protein (TIGR01451 family)
MPSVPAVQPAPVSHAAPVGTPNVAVPFTGATPAGVEYLRTTPAGIMAPVGSEVVLKAGICGCDGNLLPNRRVEWQMCGAGQFSDMGTVQQVGYVHWPFDTPRKVDNANAVSATTLFPTTLYRITPDPADDVQILRGDAWVTLTSACEGTSVVTASTPALRNYNRVTSTIYWVDVHWLVPQSTVADAGRPHVLTTTVMRRTDNAPLAGWLVRYDVASGGALGYEGGRFVEVPTDAAGRASVEVSPVTAGGGTTNVTVTVIRPALPQIASPRLPIGSSSATIVWSGTPAPGAVSVPVPPSAPPAGVPYTESPYTPAPTLPAESPSPPFATPQDSTPRPSLPNTPTPSNPSAPPANPYAPPVDEPQTGRPQLELQLRRTGPEQVGVGEFTSFEITIRNTGNGTARGIVVEDRFDPGLRHPEAKPNELAVRYPGVRDLPPGESATVPLTFQVVAGGMQCHEVTVSATGTEPVKQRGCVSAIQAVLEVSVTGPRSRVVGETAPFNIVVKNSGDVAATNVELVLQFDSSLNPTEIGDPNHQRLPDGGISIRIDRLEAAERRPFEMRAQCVTQSDRACTRAVATADGGVTSAADACVEILPPLPTR